jgi:hypothetical protein
VKDEDSKRTTDRIEENQRRPENLPPAAISQWFVVDFAKNILPAVDTYRSILLSPPS